MKIAVIISYYIFKICGISINRALNIAAKNITKKNSGYIYIRIYIYIYIYILYIYIYVYMYICIYIYDQSADSSCFAL